MNLQLIRKTTLLRQGLVVDPQAKHYKRMRQALWLYLYLLLAVNPGSGKRLLAPEHIARDMGLTEETVRSWLGHLRKNGYVSVARQGGLVRVTVAKWPKLMESRESIPGRASAPRVQSDQPSPEQIRLAKALGCAPEEPFLKEVLAREDTDRIRVVLKRVSQVPQSQIRKSRLALFRYLLARSNDT